MLTIIFILVMVSILAHAGKSEKKNKSTGTGTVAASGKMSADEAAKIHADILRVTGKKSVTRNILESAVKADSKILDAVLAAWRAVNPVKRAEIEALDADMALDNALTHHLNVNLPVNESANQAASPTVLLVARVTSGYEQGTMVDASKAADFIKKMLADHAECKRVASLDITVDDMADLAMVRASNARANGNKSGVKPEVKARLLACGDAWEAMARAIRATVK